MLDVDSSDFTARAPYQNLEPAILCLFLYALAENKHFSPSIPFSSTKPFQVGSFLTIIGFSDVEVDDTADPTRHRRHTARLRIAELYYLFI